MNITERLSATFLVLLSALVLSSCNSDEYDKLRAELLDMKTELNQLKEETYALEVKKQDMEYKIRDLESIQDKVNQLHVETDDVEEYHRDLKSAVEYSKTQSDSWKKATRKSLIGEKLDLLRLDGKVITNAVILKLDEENVMLKHNDGDESIKLSALPEPVRKKLIHEPTIILESEILN